MEREEVPKLFFTKEEQDQIVREVTAAEEKTSAEIVVRLERNCPGDPLTHCRDLLQSLGITQTKSRTGVILYISLEDHKVAIYGDEAVNNIIGQQRWKEICGQIVEGFQTGKPCEALCEAIRSIVEVLAPRLPCKVGDVNELPNELSFQDERK
jgi:uncharacterized membrane protein